MNTVGPYHNRQETYGYFTLPFCAGPRENIGHYHETMSEALQGTELEYSGLQIEFKGDIAKSEYCKVALDDNNLKAFLYAGSFISFSATICSKDKYENLGIQSRVAKLSAHI